MNEPEWTVLTRNMKMKCLCFATNFQKRILTLTLSI